MWSEISFSPDLILSQKISYSGFLLDMLHISLFFTIVKPYLIKISGTSRTIVSYIVKVYSDLSGYEPR